MSVALTAGCTASVDGDPFTSLGTSSATAGDSAPPATDATGDSTGQDPDDGSTSASAGSSEDEGPTSDTTTTSGECDPPCDPLTSVCEAGQCVTPDPPGVGEVVISELMPNPNLVTDDDGEWIELTNVSAGPVDLEGCVLYDSATDEDVIDSGAPIVVPPGGTVVLAKAVDAAINGGIAGVVYGFGTSYTLANTGDEVRLECGGVVVDEVAFVESWPFDAGVAMQLSSGMVDAVANDVAANWCAATMAYGVGDLGTPGQANAGC